MTRLISTFVILTLVVVTGLVLAHAGASGAAETPAPRWCLRNRAHLRRSGQPSRSANPSPGS